MDIKDYILIGGGLLIAAVIVHGFWIAWQARRDPLRLDLVKDLSTDDDDDDWRRLRAELPNGPARPATGSAPRQENLALGDPADAQAPVLLEPTDRRAAEAERSATRRPIKTEPRLSGGPRAGESPPGSGSTPADLSAGTPADLSAGTPADPSAGTPSADAPEEAADPVRPSTPERDKVADVIMPERPRRAEEPKEPRRWTARKSPQGPTQASAPARPDPGRGRGAPGTATTRKADAAVEELIMVNVLAPKGSPFVGGGLVETLRARGLRYGDMNIFHRVDPMTRANLYSVANVVEPGTFDLADLDNFRSPGVCFFMQLPGPEQPMDAFEDMLKVARDVAVRMGGSLLDEQRSVMTGQTVEHYRQRISDYCRRRMSMRA